MSDFFCSTIKCSWNEKLTFNQNVSFYIYTALQFVGYFKGYMKWKIWCEENPLIYMNFWTYKDWSLQLSRISLLSWDIWICLYVTITPPHTSHCVMLYQEIKYIFEIIPLNRSNVCWFSASGYIYTHAQFKWLCSTTSEIFLISQKVMHCDVRVGWGDFSVNRKKRYFLKTGSCCMHSTDVAFGEKLDNRKTEKKKTDKNRWFNEIGI